MKRKRGSLAHAIFQIHRSSEPLPTNNTATNSFAYQSTSPRLLRGLENFPRDLLSCRHVPPVFTFTLQFGYCSMMKEICSWVTCVLCVVMIGLLTPACTGGDGSGSSSEECAISFCGCTEDTTMTFDATIQDASMMPLVGIELFCFGENMPIAVSDDMGKFSFSIQTQMSPGCGYARCNNMRVHDPSGKYVDLEGTYFSFNKQTLSMP